MKVIAPTFNFGPLSLFALILQSELFQIEVSENYQKRGVRNKYIIINHLGKQTLSIPLKSGKNNQQPITEVTISYEENWQAYHIKSLKAAYRKSAYFEFYIGQIEALYANQYNKLVEFNKEAVKLCLDLLKIEKEINYTSEFIKAYDQSYIDLRKTDEKIDLKFEKYNQVFEDRLPFIPNASILDLLFALGPQSKSYLSRIKVI
jgi:hypothetical protein